MIADEGCRTESAHRTVTTEDPVPGAVGARRDRDCAARRAPQARRVAEGIDLPVAAEHPITRLLRGPPDTDRVLIGCCPAIRERGRDLDGVRPLRRERVRWS